MANDSTRPLAEIQGVRLGRLFFGQNGLSAYVGRMAVLAKQADKITGHVCLELFQHAE